MKLRNIFFGMIFAAFTFCAASQELNNLEIKSLDQFCFTNQESASVLEIPGVRPSEVQNEMPGLPAGVSFVSSRRTEFYSDAGEAGISVELWLNFKSAGSYSIPPMPVRIKGRAGMFFVPNSYAPLLSLTAPQKRLNIPKAFSLYDLMYDPAVSHSG